MYCYIKCNTFRIQASSGSNLIIGPNIYTEHRISPLFGATAAARLCPLLPSPYPKLQLPNILYHILCLPLNLPPPDLIGIPSSILFLSEFIEHALPSWPYLWLIIITVLYLNLTARFCSNPQYIMNSSIDSFQKNTDYIPWSNQWSGVDQLAELAIKCRSLDKLKLVNCLRLRRFVSSWWRCVFLCFIYSPLR